MSFTFTIPKPALAGRTVAEILAASSDAPVVVAEEVDLDGPWPAAILHVHVDGVCIRGVELSRDAQGFGIRIMACSSPGDLTLAMGLLRTVAGAPDALVEPEDADPMPLSAVLERYDEAWQAGQVEYGPRVFASMVDRDGSDMTLFGARRTYVLGPRHLADLRARDGDLHDVLLADLLASQFVPTDEIFEASILRIGTDDAFHTLSVVGPGVRYLLPPVDRFALIDPEGEPVEVPAALLPTLVTVRFMDEKHCFLEPVPEADWPGVLAAARAALAAGPVVASDEDEPPPKKPWWKFW